MRDTDYISDVKYLCGIIVICILALIASPLIIITGAGCLIWEAVGKRM